MTENYKKFPLRVVLSVTTNRLLTRSVNDDDDGFADIAKLLKHMTGEPPFTQNLYRLSNVCTPFLLAAFPKLKDIDRSPLNEITENASREERNAIIEEWLSGLYRQGFNEFYLIGKLPQKTK